MRDAGVAAAWRTVAGVRAGSRGCMQSNTLPANSRLSHATTRRTPEEPTARKGRRQTAAASPPPPLQTGGGARAPPRTPPRAAGATPRTPPPPTRRTRAAHAQPPAGLREEGGRDGSQRMPVPPDHGQRPARRPHRSPPMRGTIEQRYVQHQSGEALPGGLSSHSAPLGSAGASTRPAGRQTHRREALRAAACSPASPAGRGLAAAARWLLPRSVPELGPDDGRRGRQRGGWASRQEASARRAAAQNGSCSGREGEREAAQIEAAPLTRPASSSSAGLAASGGSVSS